MITLLPKQISFVDENKEHIQYNHSTPVFNDSQKYNCMWCTLPIHTKPLGCPIEKIRSYIVNKKNYNKIIGSTESNTFKTDGVFCSFNCIMAHIQDNENLNKYKKSIHLLHAMHRAITNGVCGSKITAAPHYNCLIRFGGFMTDDEYRKNISTFVENMGMVNMYPSSTLYYI